MSPKQDTNQSGVAETARTDSVAHSILGEDAQVAAANDAEHNDGLLDNLKKFPNAVGWSVLISATIIMEGFDIVLINSLLAVPAFQRAFGEELPNGDWQITAAWQAGLTNGALIGQILGLMLNGIIADRYGFRKTLIGALMAITGFIFIVFFIQSLPQLLIGLILCGIPWGVFQTLTGTYAAEVCPTNLRSYLTSYVNMNWVMGQFLASAVLQGVGERTDQWAYRIPYALQWMFPVPLMIGIYLAPESPWWLVRKGRIAEAKQVLVRLASRKADSLDLDNMVRMMEQTNEYEKSINEGTSYLNCFKGVDLRRTEIVCAVWLVQTLCGSTFMGYSTYFYQQAGLEVSASFSMSLGQYALGLIGVVVSWFLMPHFGRRTLYVWGQGSLCLLLLIIGFSGIAARQEGNDAARWAIGSMLLVFTFVYDATVGPVCYSLVMELPSTRLRQKTVVLARNAYNIASIVTNVLTTRQLNPGAWNWGPYSAFFWAGTGAIMFVWSFFRLPEPKNRTYGELDILFHQKVPARKFAQTNVNVETNELVLAGDEKQGATFVEKA